MEVAMKRLFFLSALLIAAGLPAHAQQRLGSSGDLTGVGGAYAVYTPQEIETNDDAGYTAHYNTMAKEQGISSTRRPRPWVLGGGQAVKSSAEYQKEFEIKRKNAEEEYKKLKELRKKYEEQQKKQREEEEKQRQEEADNADASQNNDVAAQSAQSAQSDSDGETVSGIDDDGTLVCVKFQKCDICNRKTPYWSGKECVSGAVITKMKKAQSVPQNADAKSANTVKQGNGAKRNAVSVNAAAPQNAPADQQIDGAKKDKAAKSAKKAAKQSKKSSKNAKNASAAKTPQNNNSAANTAASVGGAPAASSATAATSREDMIKNMKDEYGIRLYNDDGTPKSKKQLYKERQQARIKAFREKNKKSK